MNFFERATEDEIKKNYFELIVKIMWSGPHSYERAKILSWYILVTPITDIINISMNISTFPNKIKEAHVRPLLKKTYLPKLTKKIQACILLEFVLEKVVADWLQAFIQKYPSI